MKVHAHQLVVKGSDLFRHFQEHEEVLWQITSLGHVGPLLIFETFRNNQDEYVANAFFADAQATPSAPKKKTSDQKFTQFSCFLSFVCLLLLLISFRFHANYFYFKNCENLLSLPDAWRERIVLLLFLSIANFGFLRKQFFKDLLLAHARWVLRIRSAHFVKSTIIGHFKLHYVESREGP